MSQRSTSLHGSATKPVVSDYRPASPTSLLLIQVFETIPVSSVGDSQRGSNRRLCRDTVSSGICCEWTLLGADVHLRDTSIDVDGHILADGRLSYPPDDKGLFPESRSGQFRISARDTLIRIAAAIAQRDPDSHFFVSKEVGAVVVIPEALSLLIRRALAARCLTSQQAQLAWSGRKPLVIERRTIKGKDIKQTGVKRLVAFNARNRWRALDQTFCCLGGQATYRMAVPACEILDLQRR